MSDVLNIDAILSAGLVDRVIYRQCVSSTNDLARELAATACRQECWLLVAEQQTAGRGRGDNRWWTGEGSLAFSLLVDPEHLGIHGPRLPMVSLAAAVAVVEASQPLVSGWKVGLHWPNDVYACGRKLAGILTEVLPDGRLIVGIGVNVNNRREQAPAEVAHRVCSLSELAGRPLDRTRVLAGIIAAQRGCWRTLAAEAGALAVRADALCLQHGQSLCIEAGGRRSEGVCRGIAEDGGLMLETAHGLRRFYSGVLV
ncbi:MAG: biotin--[acetyl-CoA-carboxylase] ligase [Pirellulales bacterium]|nr:biotin--[acetyl-CoA-carboxylase] ligase [Pirellulales bacterium]